MRVVIDAMGGDHAPAEILQGVREIVASGFSGKILLAGRREILEAAGLPSDKVEIVHAEHVVGMAASATSRDEDSSIAVGLRRLASGDADALLTAGNTGAFMAQAVMNLRSIEGIRRPAIPVTMPTGDGYVVLLDAGATTDCKPEHLLQFAVMGSVYARARFGLAKPRVALLSNGSEKKKGNRLVKEAAALLEAADIGYQGYVEGDSLFAGAADVVVCDGFLGNVVLKVCEGFAGRLLRMVRDELLAGGMPVDRVGGLLSSVRKKTDYMEYGGAPLLGVQGLCVKCHGASKARAIVNAVALLSDLHRADLNGAIASEVRRLSGSAGPVGGRQEGDELR